MLADNGGNSGDDHGGGGLSDELLAAAHRRNARVVLYQVALIAFPQSPVLLRAICADLEEDSVNDPVIVAAAASALCRLPADALLRFFLRPRAGLGGGGGDVAAQRGGEYDVAEVVGGEYDLEPANGAVERLLGHEDPSVAACAIPGLARAALRSFGVAGRLKQPPVMERGFESLPKALQFKQMFFSKPF